ncbi:UrcA family protein [Novosphingobium sp. PhB165]|uniref:UrcA family protein n=1 Tax=Novosphingobium sp. PhB165 TaxID=2485105 RepID=UPI0010E2BBD0|nr:UrcA family protein [Novosphingobium sp. PhB165]TCM19600.1 UrcA family protein [Novosphingobium sp. PhB165]
MTKVSLFASAVLFGAALGLAAPAMAEDVLVKNRAIDPNVPRVEVRYSDLDLDSQAGRDRLTTRLDSAVRTVCGDADVRNLDDFSHMRDCRDESTDRAYAARDELFAQHMAARASGQTLASAGTPQTMAVFARR